MSSLQLWLAIAGGLILAAVVAHGAWTSRKNAPLQAVPDEPSAPSDSRNSDGPSGLGSPMDPALVLTDAEFASPNFSIPKFSIPPIERKPLLDALMGGIAKLGAVNSESVSTSDGST